MPREERKKSPRKLALPIETPDLLTYILIGFLLLLLLLQAGETQDAVTHAYERCRTHYETQRPGVAYNFQMNLSFNNTGGPST